MKRLFGGIIGRFGGQEFIQCIGRPVKLSIPVFCYRLENLGNLSKGFDRVVGGECQSPVLLACKGGGGGGGERDFVFVCWPASTGRDRGGN